jgi:hypothetical protein
MTLGHGARRPGDQRVPERELCVRRDDEGPSGDDNAASGGKPRRHHEAPCRAGEQALLVRQQPNSESDQPIGCDGADRLPRDMNALP